MDPTMTTDTQKTIIFMGVFGLLGVLIMSLRLLIRRLRAQTFTSSDYLTLAAILCLVARTAFTTVVVLWGNNNITAAYRASHVFDADDVYEREVGSKLTIVNRIVYNTYIWIQKAVVLLLYHRILSGLPWPRRIIRFYWVVLVLTYLGAQAVTFVECSPLSLYWQVVPDPGDCTNAPLQLIVFISLNLVTDVMLIILPMPWIIPMKRSIKERLQLIAIFSVGFLVIAIAFVRLPVNWGTGTTQVNRNIWGSVEAFAAAFVANVPTLFALRRKPNASNRNSAVSFVENQRFSRGVGADGGVLVTTSVELALEHKPSSASSEASWARYWEAWEKGDGRGDPEFGLRTVV